MKKINHTILISIDNLRGDSFGPNKYKYLPANIRENLESKSHLMEELATEGLNFKNCFSAAPFTTASHASIFTGFLPLHHGVFEYYNSDMKKKTLFEYAQRDGYKTIFQTDFPIILGETIGFTRGVDKYYIEDEYAALEELKSNIHSKTITFFHFGGVHYPYGFHTLKFGGDDYRKKVQSLEKELRIDENKLPVDQFDEAHRMGEDKELLFRYKRIIEHLYAQKNFKRLTELYFEGVDYFLEHRLRPFMVELRKVLENSDYLIVLFGDHGEDWSDESKGHYKSLTPGVLHVPLIILGSDIVPGIIESNVCTVDITPTILSTLGIKVSDAMDGSVLDLQNPLEIEKNKGTSIAQVWLGVGKQELISHIDRAHRDKGFTEKMDTIKRGESIIKNDYQLTRKFDKQGKLENEKLTSLSDMPVPNNVMESLLKELEEYNKTSLHIDQKNLTDDSIKEQLKLLGYNI
ncbi:MAG: sulfatase-like hydrolase/transferase [bacterium]|nr:sulfatase-like hydrolase/transferase [bacterium]